MLSVILIIAAVLVAGYAAHELGIGRAWGRGIVRDDSGALGLVIPARRPDVVSLPRRIAALCAANEPLVLVGVSVAAAVVFYLPFLLHLPSFNGLFPFDHHSMEQVYGMWDGPFWITTAGTLWDPNPHNPIYLGWQPHDLAERFPLFPLVIRAVAPLLGYWNGALLVNVAASTGVTLLLYAFLRRFGTVPSAAFWIALASIFWPPRGLLYRYVIMAEPLFILCLLAAAYGFKSRRYALCGLCGALAVAARSNGFLVIAGFGLMALGTLLTTPHGQRVQQARRLAWLLLLPLTLGAIYLLHQLRFGDWLASYHATDFVHPQAQLYPFLSSTVGDEGLPYLLLLVAAGIIELARRGHWDLAVLSLVFYVPDLFVSADVTRYLLPILPFAYGLAGERLLAARPVRIALVLSLPLAYMFSWTFLLHDQPPPAPFAALRHMLP